MDTPTKNRYATGQYLADNPDWHSEDSPWKANQIYRLMSNHKLPTQSVIEVGCGAGEILVQLQSQLPDTTQLTGYDISPQAIQLCQSKSNDRLSFECGKPNPDTPRDISLAIDVFEHIDDVYGFLRSFKQTATYKIFHIPLDLSVQTILRTTPLRICNEKLGHIHFYTENTALMALRHAGYEIVDYRYTAAAIEAPGNPSLKKTLLNVPRRLLFALNQDFAVRLLGGYSLLVLSK